MSLVSAWIRGPALFTGRSRCRRSASVHCWLALDLWASTPRAGGRVCEACFSRPAHGTALYSLQYPESMSRVGCGVWSGCRGPNNTELTCLAGQPPQATLLAYLCRVNQISARRTAASSQADECKDDTRGPWGARADANGCRPHDVAASCAKRRRRALTRMACGMGWRPFPV
jgi:hypothetical protein